MHAGSKSISSDNNGTGAEAHILALDGIRGLAILMVLYHHLFWANPDSGNHIFDFLNAIRGASFTGVNLFFALSGFLITGILLNTLTTPHFFKTFYARRILRIFPLYYGVLIVLLLLTKPFHFVWNGWQYFYLTYVANLVIWPRPASNLQNITIDHFWSLQVEEQFYLVWPFIVYRIRSLKSLIRLSVIACIVVLLIRIGLVAARPYLRNAYLMYSPTFSCVDNLLFGCCLCVLLRTSMRQKVLDLAPYVFAACIFVLIGLCIPNGGLKWQTSLLIPTIGFSLVGIACASLIAMALRPGSRTQSIFSNKVLRFFGKYSYGLYIFHYLVGGLLTSHVRHFVDARFHHKALGVFAGAAVVSVAAILTAFLSYNLYESRFLRLKKYFSYGQNNIGADSSPILQKT